MKEKFMQQSLASWVRTADTLVDWAGASFLMSPKLRVKKQGETDGPVHMKTGYDC